MPSKGSVLIHGKRYSPLNKKLHKEFVKETGIEIDYKTFKNVILTTNVDIRDAILNSQSGVELPKQLGHIVVKKIKSNRKGNLIDYGTSKKLGKKVPFLNLHSFGCFYRVEWIKINCIFKYRAMYKMVAMRPLKRMLAKRIKSGAKYFEWKHRDFLKPKNNK